MDIGTFRGLLTLILMILFIALVFWAYSRGRKEDFEAAARLPLDDDDRLSRAVGRGTEKD
ncbi:MAG: cbb3-type cytochrome c oxidase subunit 3 [Gammaproteobacteria bacterium]|jgi:cytochrome c oxidase cbb3-type subunit 4